MARPANPETIAALKKRIEKLEGLVLGLLEREDDPPALLSHEAVDTILVEELNLALGLTPGTLEGRVELRLTQQSAT